MSAATVLDLVKSYATAMGQPAEDIVRVLSDISDEHSIPLKVYGGGVVLNEPREVLNPLSIKMKNMMGVSERIINFEPGVTLVYGPNGSGKTTTMRAMLYALFGGPAAGVRQAEDLILRGQSALEVELAFAGGKVKRGCSRSTVKRGANAGKEEVEHELEASIGGDKANTAKPAQALINAWLGADGAFIRRVCCLEQGMLTQVMDEEPARRRELFYRMLSLDPCEATRKSLQQVLTVEENAVGMQRQDVERLTAEIATLQHKRDTYPVHQLKRERDVLAPAAASASVNPEELKRLQHVLARRELDKVEAAQKMATRTKYVAKLDEIKRDPALTAVHEDLSKDLATEEHAVNTLRSTLGQHQAALEGIKARGVRVKELPSVCPTCQAIGKLCEVTPEVKEQTLLAIRKEWSTVERERQKVAGELAQHQATLEGLRAKQEAQVRTQSQQKFLAEQMRMLEGAILELPAFIDTAAIDADIAATRQAIKNREQMGSPKAVEDLAAIDTAIAQATALEAQIKDVTAKRDKLAKEGTMPHADLEALRWAVAAFAKDGMPLWLARQHLERVNAIAAEVCTLDRYRYSFGPDLEVIITSGGDTVTDVGLNLLREADGEQPAPRKQTLRIGPELTCGSARERGAVVLMAALGRYLQELSGLSIPFLWVDELPFQDQANANLVVDMVKRLTQWYPKVVLCCSQWDDFLEQFDHEIALLPDDVAVELDRQRQAKLAVDARKKPSAKPLEGLPGGFQFENPPETPAPAGPMPGKCSYEPQPPADPQAAAIAAAEAAIASSKAPQMDSDLEDEVPF